MTPIILQAAQLLLMSYIITGLFACRDACHLYQSQKPIVDKINARLLGGVCVNFILIVSFTSVQFLSVNCKWQAGVQDLLEKAPISFLALVVALAAYTSNILTKLRESITKLKAEVKAIERAHRDAQLAELADVQASLQKHRRNYEWLAWADFLLVLTGLVFVITGFGGTLGEPDAMYQSICMALLFTIIGYFAALHIRQWLKKS